MSTGSSMTCAKSSASLKRGVCSGDGDASIKTLSMNLSTPAVREARPTFVARRRGDSCTYRRT